jgi:4-amino-4-deoxy-L-arabinose transferase-like glycosyltransferase
MSVRTGVKRHAEAVALPTLRLGSWKLVLVLAGICILPILLYAPFFNEPFHRDEGFYAAVAQIMRHGGIPYRDAFDNKPPLIFAWYYAAFALFGEHIWAPRLLVSLLISATTLLVYFQARFIYSQRGALVAAAAFAMSMGFAVFETNANVEYFMLLPTVAALLCFTIGERRGGLGWYLLAGALSGVSVMTKETSVFAFALFFLIVAWREYKEHRWGFMRSGLFWRKSLAMGIAFLLALGLVFTPFLLTGTSKDFFDAVFIYTWLYVGGGQGDVFKLQQIVTAPAMLVIATGPFVIFGAFGLWAFRRRKEWSERKLVALWSVAAMLGVIAAGRFFAHYYVILLPGIALLLPAGVVYVRDRWQTEKARLVVWSLLAVSLITPVGLAGAIYLHTSADARHEQKFFQIDRAQWETEGPALAEWIDARTTPDDYIYNMGFQADVYFYAQRRSPTRFMFDYPFFLNHQFELDAIQDLKANMPKYVFYSPLDEPPSQPGGDYYPQQMYDFIQQNYDYLGRIYYADVWQLKRAPLPGPGIQPPL